MEPNEKELKRLDPESEACFKALKDAISWEIEHRVPAIEDPATPEGRESLSELIADTILDGFVVRKRKSPRSAWTDGGKKESNGQ
jgi:hypothetical protein